MVRKSTAGQDFHVSRELRRILLKEHSDRPILADGRVRART